MITQLGQRSIMPDAPPYFVAELGPNFVVSTSRAANLERLHRMVREAARAGADCVKIQLKSMSGFYAGDDMTRPPHDPARSPFSTMPYDASVRASSSLRAVIINSAAASKFEIRSGSSSLAFR